MKELALAVNYARNMKIGNADYTVETVGVF